MSPLFFWSIASISFFTYTQLYYQTIRIFARACSDKNLLLMLSPYACQFAAGMYRIAPLSFLHLFSFPAHIMPEKGRFGELLSKLPIKFGNKAKSAFLPYSCLDIIQLGMKKRTAVIYRRPFLVIPNCRVKPSAEPRKRKTPKSLEIPAFFFIWSECNYRISENADISTVCWQSTRGIYSKNSK